MPAVPSLLRTRIFLAIMAFITVIAVGTIGYAFLLDWTYLDSLYMSIITISTVGYREIYELDDVGKIFTIGLIFVGVGSFTYLVSTLHNYLIAGQLFGRLERRAMEKRVAKLDQHVIVCGFGSMGEQVVDSLIRESTQVVVIDRSVERCEAAMKLGVATLQGDAEEDEALKQAGIERARALVTAVDDDASNLMITLTARGLNQDLYIVARINRRNSERKLKQAGADRILWPYGLAGRRIAQMALRPGVVEFLEVVQRDAALELKLEEARVGMTSQLVGKTIAGAELRKRTGVTILALRHNDGQLELTTPESQIQGGDLLLALGSTKQVDQLKALATSDSD